MSDARIRDVSFRGPMPAEEEGRNAIAVPTLPRQAIKALLHGKHARLGGKTAASRGKRLVEIAAAYTREELLSEHGVGMAISGEIELWLKAHGRCLRSSREA